MCVCVVVDDEQVFDTNKNGTLSVSEWLHGMTVVVKGTLQEKIKFGSKHVIHSVSINLMSCRSLSLSLSTPSLSFSLSLSLSNSLF